MGSYASGSCSSWFEADSLALMFYFSSDDENDNESSESAAIFALSCHDALNQAYNGSSDQARTRLRNEHVARTSRSYLNLCIPPSTNLYAVVSAFYVYPSRLLLLSCFSYIPFGKQSFLSLNFTACVSRSACPKAHRGQICRRRIPTNSESRIYFLVLRVHRVKLNRADDNHPDRVLHVIFRYGKPP